MDQVVGGPRGVLCADADAMFAAIEALERGIGPDVPILVGGSPDQRGVVSTASYAARRFGCHSAMPMAQALRLCPQALRFPPRHELYARYSHAIMEILRPYGPLEPMSIDEAFVEISAEGITPSLGQEIKAAIRQETSLTVSIGIGRNKLVSKVASGHQKPDGLTVVPLGQEAAFLAPLAVGRISGVGPKTQARLAELGIHTCGELAEVPLETLMARFGAAQGQALYEHARGIDNDPVVTRRDLKQVSQEVTFTQDVIDRTRLWATVRELSAGVGRRLQTHRLLTRAITLKLRYGDFQSMTRAATLPVPTDDPAVIARVTALLIRANWNRSRPIRLIGVGATRLVSRDSWLQLPLPLDE